MLTGKLVTFGTDMGIVVGSYFDTTNKFIIVKYKEDDAANTGIMIEQEFADIELVDMEPYNRMQPEDDPDPLVVEAHNTKIDKFAAFVSDYDLVDTISKTFQGLLQVGELQSS